MRYISRRHTQWIGLVELVELVQAESGYSVEEARNWIRDALEEGTIWPLRWEPEPAPSEYCRARFGAQALAHGKPIYPPPPSPETKHDFRDTRDVSHWRDVEINWEKGLILDDFERQIYRKLDGNLWPVMGWHPEGYPKPRSPEWRSLWLDRRICKQIWTPAETKDVGYRREEAAVVGGDPEKQLGNIERPLSQPYDDVESEGKNHSAVDPDVYAPIYRTGLVGKPTSWHLIKAECRRRYKTDERHLNSATGAESPAEWARVLIDWLKSAHKEAPWPTHKTLTNKLSGFLRELQGFRAPDTLNRAPDIK